jgi:transposase InsO family protein
MSQACSISVRRAYGLQRLCRVWEQSRSTVYARRSRSERSASLRRRGPLGAGSDEELVSQMRRVLEASPFHGEGYRKVWAKLRCAGIRTSKERVRRLMREHGLQAPHRVGHPHGPRAHDGTITTESPNAMWGTDMTTTVTVGEGQAFVFVAVDHCTTECIGLHASRSGSRFEALEPIRQGVREYFGGFAEGIADGLALRHDHGSNYLADDFQKEVAFLGIESSPSFVREPEGNGVAERFIRTLKENFLWVRSFETIEELREALLEFKRTYNEQWMLEKYDYRSPAQVRRDLEALDEVA